MAGKTKEIATRLIRHLLIFNQKKRKNVGRHNKVMIMCSCSKANIQEQLHFHLLLHERLTFSWENKTFLNDLICYISLVVLKGASINDMYYDINSKTIIEFSDLALVPNRKAH